ncbi:MAG: 30S ribosomal protein S17 [Candidatus Woykebacteria bacterium RBG_19FT_COMBO_43_10]|uniref:Small ribosomal subunit protein uS17 n=1 Tax=Candidatus Woykebacteria bacterium RBG_19FT_COMBO_43_10 TaxID=1802598 RepID=A0A1G1WHP0_9BACT|nr:MAG: 30S ribosomal protein S17 [Candidatus Woykebacteria bacterium RBG_19FT_COMBO_43_10]
MEFIGKVVSTRMNKTAVVEVERFISHPLYKKRIKKVKKFKAHDEIGVSVGEKVQISSVKPISKEKHFKIVRLVEK